MILSPNVIIDKFKDKFKDKMLDSHLVEKKEGVTTEVIQRTIWIKVERNIFHSSVEFLNSISFPHICCPMPSKIKDEVIELIYPFSIYDGLGNFDTISVIISVDIPKNDLTIPTLTDVIPGIIYMERETQEMLGIKVLNIPDGRRLFTPDNMDEIEEGMLPFRNDLGYGYDDYYEKRKGEK